MKKRKDKRVTKVIYEFFSCLDCSWRGDCVEEHKGSGHRIIHTIVKITEYFLKPDEEKDDHRGL